MATPRTRPKAPRRGARWRPCTLESPPKDWRAILPAGVSSKNVLGFDKKTGQPLEAVMEARRKLNPTQRFGTVLENVVLDDERRPDFDDGSLTENTRCAYPLHFIPNASATGKAGHPKNIIMLTADAFGVMPPIARMTPAQVKAAFAVDSAQGDPAGVELEDLRILSQIVNRKYCGLRLAVDLFVIGVALIATALIIHAAV